MFVMLLISVITQIPELNLAKLFSLENTSNDPERQLLSEATSNSTSYSRQIDEDDTLSQHQHTSINQAISTESDSQLTSQRPKY